MKRRVKRPTLHYLIVIGYVLAPVVNVLLIAIFVDAPLNAMVRGLPRAYGWLMLAWLVTAPLVGLGLLLLRRVSWYAFLLHGSIVIVDFVIRTLIRPVELQAQQPLHTALLIGGNVVLVAVIAYVLQRDFRAPYLQVLSRAFREDARVPIRRELTVGGHPAVTSDFSAGGCFVSSLPAALGEPNVGDRLAIAFGLHRLEVACDGEVMRTEGGGIGVRFLGLSGPTKRALRAVVRHHYALRYAISVPARWRHGDRETPCSVVNISKGGCYLAADPPAEGEGFAEGQVGMLALALPATVEPATRSPITAGPELAVRAQLAWVNADGQFDKPIGFGVHFATSLRRLVRQLLRDTRAVLVR